MNRGVKKMEKMSPDSFFEWISPSATKICKKYGIYPSVCMAQAAIESGWGESIIGEYNLFGRKAVEGDNQIILPTDEYINGQWVVVDAPFKLYNTLDEAIEDYCILLTSTDWNNPYLKCLQFLPNRDEYVQCMAGVYATSPAYAKSILNTIRANNLTKYDGV
jgi:flagellar protein FlgJ